MIREVPGGSVAVHVPSWAVVTAAACVNAFEPLSGAVRIATGWPARGRLALLTSSPCSLTGRPKATVARLASLAEGVSQLWRGGFCWRPVALAIVDCCCGSESETAALPTALP